MSKQLAGTAQNKIAYFNDKNEMESGIELILCLVEKQYFYKNNSMQSDILSETVRLKLSKVGAETLRDTLIEIVKDLS